MVFLGKEINEQRDYSDAIADSIDKEIAFLIDKAHKLATKVIKDHQDVLEKLAQHLMIHESIEGDELKDLLAS